MSTNHQRLASCILCITIAYGGALKFEKEGHYRSLAVAPEVDPSFDGKMPIEFVHVPKCGSSFIRTLLHIPGACSNLPQSEDDIDVNNFTIPSSWKCNSSVLDIERFAHKPIETLPNGGFEAAKGRFMIMLRQPEQRLLSEMNMMSGPTDKYLEWYMSEKSGALTKQLVEPRPPGGEDMACENRAKYMMVTGNPCNNQPPPTRDEVEIAKSRLRTGFSFIGLTDQWDLSICLFNTMFNQTCRSFQFQNSRPTRFKKESLYDTTAMKGWRDPYDSEPYEVGLQIFEANLKKYNVSESSCGPCWREAGLL